MLVLVYLIVLLRELLVSTIFRIVILLKLNCASRSIPWENAIGFASDSASVMVGIRITLF